MSSDDSPINLGKQAPPARPGPAWIVMPARVVALVVVVPLRLVYELVLVLGRGVLAVWNGLMRVPVWIGRLLYRFVLAPFGRLLAAIGRALAAVFGPPLRWLGRMLLVPLRLLARGLAWLLNVLVVLPCKFLWRYVLRPPLLALAWLGRGVVVVLRAFGAAMVWSWRLIGRCLAWLARHLIVLPLQMLWRYVLGPIVAAVVGTWRFAARVLRWLWNVLVVVPVRVLVVVPVRWIRTNVLRPVWHGVRETWRVCVGDPVRAVRRTLRDAGRDVRLQLRRVFRGH
ncbi:hypothetical protein BZB76_1261 [Actinomadura pelletieri DSM 43383]|uniref:Uncharacterized protein n=1 Tax=Actinomadura pelletieri DSM 43383 TaxID=1120940 RepID=A0A495R0H5_9ACTN|nr:hypothetical protein [Actinomadura pelletieri]RKS79782.1 hypothetical protein BZB76_1261 [Actinomadura pelletieri DSM 43383]